MRLRKTVGLHASLLLLTLALTISAQLDATFGTAGRALRIKTGSQAVVKTLLLPDGKILAVTQNSQDTFPGANFTLVRYNSDGSVDTSYGTGGEVTVSITLTSQCCPLGWGIRDALRQPDGKIVLVGSDNDALIVRLNADGTLDNTFSGDGIARPDISIGFVDMITSVFYEPDGKLLCVGITHNDEFLMRYDSSGNQDPTYGDGGGVKIHALGGVFEFPAGRQSDGRPVGFVEGAGKIYRFNNNGFVDNTFASPTLTYDGFVRKLVVLPNDKIMVVDNPQFTDQFQRTQYDIRVRRFNADGTLDTSFGASGSLTIDISHNMPDHLSGVTAAPDGSVVIAAETYVELNRSSIGGYYLSLVKLDPSGAIAGRSLPTLSDGGAGPVVMLPDGKILAASYVITDTNVNYTDVLLTRHTGVPLTNYHFRAAPMDIASTSLGYARAAVRRPSTNQWFLSGFTLSNVGTAGDIATPSDYTGTFGVDIAYFRPSTGTWFISGSYYTQTLIYTQVRWGTAGDIPVPYDYDGDGKSDVAVFRPSDGNWYVRRSIDTEAVIQHWGANGDKPVTGDYDGDGSGDIAVFRPSDGNWYINRSSDGGATIVHFGISEDIPVQEDYDGDGKTDIAVWRPSTGVWYIWRSTDGGFTIAPFGLSTDIPTPADYDNDKKADISVFRAGTWYQYLSTTNAPTQFQFGAPTDIPLSGRN